MALKRALEDFAGRWRLEKRISAEGQAPARFEGHAEWVPVAEGLAYTEHGQLWVGAAAPLEAERRYLWRAGLAVFFDDGRFFHTVPAQGGRAHHSCPPDKYVVDYTFETWPSFTATWHVTGPRKNYVMTALYERSPRLSTSPFMQ